METLTTGIKNHPFVKKLMKKGELGNGYHKKGRALIKSPSLPVEQINMVIDEERGTSVRKYINQHVDLSSGDTFLTATTTRFNILKLPYGQYSTIINLQKVNAFRWLNKFFEAVNDKLPVGGVFINSVEIYTNRKRKILHKSPFPFNRIHYFFDVLYARVMPKLPVLKKIYFQLTQGKYRALSKAETFGRLYSCGFEVVDEKFVGNELFFVARKVKKPVFDPKPTYGALIRLKRHGRGGELFNVYKLRTMYAYSEYLQQYVFEHNHLQDGGKFKDDFRITTEGRFFRKFWLDELPMIFNVLKGEMKIVGVRPLSNHYFNLYSEELKQKRIRYKPGLVPPFYADMPKTLEEIVESELRYIEAYEKHPFRTDFAYFFKAFYNILIKKARSN